MDEKIDLDAKIAILLKQVCFLRLTSEEIETLAGLLKEQKFAAGQTLVTEGELVDSIYLIVKGTAQVQHISLKNGVRTTQTVATLNPGEAIGLNETGFYSLTGLRTATVIAGTDMLVLRLSVAAFHGFALAFSHVNEVMRSNQGLQDSSDVNNS